MEVSSMMMHLYLPPLVMQLLMKVKTQKSLSLALKNLQFLRFHLLSLSVKKN
jgi:hypothetical protein